MYQSPSFFLRRIYIISTYNVFCRRSIYNVTTLVKRFFPKHNALNLKPCQILLNVLPQCLPHSFHFRLGLDPFPDRCEGIFELPLPPFREGSCKALRLRLRLICMKINVDMKQICILRKLVFILGQEQLILKLH